MRADATSVDSLLAGFDAVTTPREARALGEELARTLVTFYGDGLERVLSIVYDACGDRGDAVIAALCEDPMVESFLCLHGLHPIPVEERVERALDTVRGYVHSHAGAISVTRIEGGVVTLRLEGSCDGCPSSTATVKLAVERAIREQVPEIHEVRAENSTQRVGV